MCTVCGCASDTKKADGHAHHDHDHHLHHHEDGTAHGHHHDHHPHTHDDDHHHHHGEDGSLHFGRGQAGVHVAGQSQSRLVKIERDILATNDALAARNRERLVKAGILTLNMMSSPGAGKTTLLVKTLEALKTKMPVAVIEGDQQTANDAERIKQTGVEAIQINTGKGCHLDADMIAHAMDHISLPNGGILFVENVGNLVCPAAFDLGEAKRVVLASVTEGEDKPLKYPEMFASADVMLLSKVDLLPHLEVDVDLYIANARKVRPGLEVIEVAAGKTPMLEAWLAWLDQNMIAQRHAAE